MGLTVAMLFLRGAIRYVPNSPELKSLLISIQASEWVDAKWYVNCNKKKEVVPMGIAVTWQASGGGVWVFFISTGLP